MRNRNFESLNSSISQFAKKLNLRLVKEKMEIVDLWPEIVGDEFSKRAEADRFNDGILFVSVSNSTWLNEITFLKDDIVSKYKQKLGRKVVKEIKCFIRKPGQEYNPKLSKANVDDNRKKLQVNKKISEEEKVQIHDQSEVIGDDRLRDALQKFLEIGRSKELSMLSQGWRRCPLCKVPHQEKEIICVTCRSK